MYKCTNPYCGWIGDNPNKFAENGWPPYNTTPNTDPFKNAESGKIAWIFTCPECSNYVECAD